MRRSVQTLEECLAACLDDMRAGVTSADCLARYPEYADELKSALLVAERLQGQAWPTLSHSGRVRGRERMHEALATRRPAGFAGWSVLRPLSVAAILLVLAAGVWLAWPGRQQVNTNWQTPAPAYLPATAAPTATLGATPTLTVTLTPTPTATAEQAGPPSIATSLPEIIEGPKEILTPLASATLRSANAPATGIKISTPPPAQAPGSVSATVQGAPMQTPDLDKAPAPTLASTREPEVTPEPTRTAEVTEEPRASATREPGEQRQPAGSPGPTSTPDPSPAVEPNDLPHAAATPAPATAPPPPDTPGPARISES